MQAATLGDSIIFKLTLLPGAYNQLIYDTTLPASVRTSVLMLKGETFERLGGLDSARNAYNYVVSHFPTSIDVMYSQWRLLKLDAIEADTTFGAVYDSLIAIYRNRVIQDLKFPRVWVEFKQAEPENNENSVSQQSGNILYQNTPNPFSSETNISFMLAKQCPVKIKISDMLGRQLLILVDEVKNKGQHSVPFRTDDFPAGVYYYSLEACGEVLTKQMQLIK